MPTRKTTKKAARKSAKTVAKKGPGKPAKPKGQRFLTGFPKYEAFLRKVMAKAELDEEAFERKLSPCNLCSCHGMCCHDGAYVAKEEIETLFDVTTEHEEALRAMGVPMDMKLFEREDDGGWKTAEKKRNMRERVENYPRHFASTACVFLLDDGRCALQQLAVDLGKHKWFYKPVTCWLHPITLGYETDPGVYLIDKDTDPDRRRGYPGFTTYTHCGRTDENGIPAREVLREELEFLGRIVGKKFVK